MNRWIVSTERIVMSSIDWAIVVFVYAVVKSRIPVCSFLRMINEYY